MDSEQECQRQEAEELSIEEGQNTENFCLSRNNSTNQIYKIKKTYEYRRFFRSPFLSGKYLSIFYLQDPYSFSYGITVTKKIGKAVVRNRLKRIIRTVINNYINDNKKIVTSKINIVLKKRACKKTYMQILIDFNMLMKQITTCQK